MEYFNIDVDSKQFRKSYLIYIVELEKKMPSESDKDGEDCKYQYYYYVGQTGDRNFKTARPAFRRLGGHFIDQGSSTQNQFYRGIAINVLGFEEAKKRTAFSDKIKNAVSDFLLSSSIRMHAYPVDDFIFDDDKKTHIEKLRFVENIERCLIQIIRTKSNSNLFNINEYEPNKDWGNIDKAKNKATKIYKHLLKKLMKNNK